MNKNLKGEAQNFHLSISIDLICLYEKLNYLYLFFDIVFIMVIPTKDIINKPLIANISVESFVLTTLSLSTLSSLFEVLLAILNITITYHYLFFLF